MVKRIVNYILVLLLLSGLLVPATLVSADSSNLIANPSAETLAGSTAASWTPDSWGSNTTSMSVSSDAHSGSRSLSIATTSYTSGDSKWIPDAVTVTGGGTYTYTDYYKSTTTTEIDAVYYDASNKASYVYLLGTPTSAAWQNASVTFTTPATAVRVSVMHILAGVGTLTTDDFSLTAFVQTPPPPPSGDNLIANPSFETANGGTPAGWLTGNWGSNTAQFVYSTNGYTGNRSAEVDVSNYTSGDAKWYFAPVSVTPGSDYTFSDYYKSSVPTALVAQFDNGSGAMTYISLASIAASTDWSQASTTFTVPAGIANATVFHLISSNGSLQVDDASLTLNTVTSQPTVTVTGPQANSTVSGTVTISATATPAQNIASVQFQVDGANLGSAVSSTPYQQTWDTAAFANGSHMLTATATTTTNTTATSAPVTVIINNTTATDNIVPNPSLETANPSNAKLPAGWNEGTWGTNTTKFSYLKTGRTGTHSVKVNVTSYTNGSSYWYFDNQPIVGGQMYDITDYYESNVISEVDAGITMNDGSVQYMYLGDPSPSKTSWTKFETQFTAPAGAVSVTIYHNVYSVGWLTTDDFSLTRFSYQGFTRPIISITDDDGYASFYNNGLPLLQKYDLVSTDYIITSVLNNDPAYMTSAMVKSLDASGQEIGSHTLTHPDLTTLSATKMDNELKNSQTFLQNLLGKPVTDFASPYGAYNTQVWTDAQKYYQTYRGVEAGYNAKNNFDVSHLMVQNLVSTTTLAEVQSWIDTAKATNTWLILVYHQIDPDTAAGDYNTYPSDFDAQLAAIKASGVAVETVNQALNEITPQL